MSSSAQDIPSTAYRGQGLDPVTVVRTDSAAKSEDSKRQDPLPLDRSSTLGRLFPEISDRESQVELKDGLHLGAYLVQSRIGAGGMGAVFKAVDQDLDRTIALKVLSPQQASDPSSIRRFQNEAKSAARLDHDNIARIYAISEDQGLHFIAFEYVEGITIRDLIRNSGTVDPFETVNYLLQIAIALKHTASAGVVHRDIKPSNLIITPTGRVKLVDWGLARKERLDEQSLDLTVSGTTLGTFDYISPEQARDPRNVDVRSDIYSLGCTAYHMLTGVPPYADGTVLQKLLDHQGKNAPDPREKNPNIPRELSRIVMKMMASSPENRYWSPQLLIEDLLQLASQAGLRAVHPDGLTWRTEDHAGGSSLSQEQIWWYLGAFVLACVMAIGFDRYSMNQESDPLTSRPMPPPSIPFFPEELPAADISAGGDSDSLEPMAVGEDDTEIRPDFDTLKHLPDGIPPFITGQFEDSPSLVEGLFSSDQDKLFSDSNSPLEQGLVRVDATELITDGTSDAETMNSNTKPLVPIPLGKFRLNSETGQELGYFSQLDEALAAVRSGGVIEYTGREPLVVPLESQMRVMDQTLTIRATAEAPIIFDCDTTLLSSSGRIKDFVLISGGSLTLQHVHFRVAIPEPMSSSWSIFHLEGASKFRGWQCSMTVDSTHQTAAAVVRLTRSTLQAIDAMNQEPGSPALERLVQIDDCFVRGATDLASVETSDQSSIELSRSVIAIDGAVVRYSGDKVTRTEKEEVSVRLARVIAIANDGLIRSEIGQAIPRQQADFRIRAEDSLVWGALSQPMLQLAGGLDVQMLSEAIKWYGVNNLLAGWSDLVSVQGANMTVNDLSVVETIRNSGSRELSISDVNGKFPNRFDQWTIPAILTALEEVITTQEAGFNLSDYGPDAASLPKAPEDFSKVAP